MNINTFSVLCFKDHIWSKIIVGKLLEMHLIPTCIIEEDSIMSNKKKDFYQKLTETSKKKIPYQNNSIGNMITEFNITNNTNIVHYVTPNHNNIYCKNILKEHPLDILILANTRIIKKDIFEIPIKGTFNCHPDKLPGYRGSVVFLRKILEDLPLGVTCHWVNEIVDTGSIAYYKDIIMEDNDTLGDIVYRIIDTSSDLFYELLTSNNIPNIPQNLNETPCFKFPDDTIIKECIDKLDLRNKQNIINNNNNNG